MAIGTRQQSAPEHYIRLLGCESELHNEIMYPSATKHSGGRNMLIMVLWK